MLPLRALLLRWNVTVFPLREKKKRGSREERAEGGKRHREAELKVESVSLSVEVCVCDSQGGWREGGCNQCSEAAV